MSYYITMLVIIWRILLILLFCATVNAVFTAIARREMFLAFFPGATGGVYFGLLAVACAGLIAFVGLWLWRCWAMALFVALGVAGFVLDVFANAPLAHKIVLVSSTLLMSGLAYLLRDRFRNAG